MGNQRVLLYITLFFIIYLIWAKWQVTYEPKPLAANPAASSQTLKQQGTAQSPQSDKTTSAGIIPQAVAVKEKQITPAVTENKTPATYIHVKTDLIDAKIDTRGGDIKQLVLLHYLEKANDKSKKVHLLSTSANQFQVVQSGLVSAQKGFSPSHNAIYKAEKLNYQLANGQNEIKVPLYWQNNQGLKVKKVLIFKRDSYVVNVNYYVTASNEKWTGSDYMQIAHIPPTAHKNKFDRSYKGGVLYNDKIKYEKHKFKDMAEKNIKENLNNGWLAIIDHYFITAWIPQKAKNNLYYSRYLAKKDEYILGVRSPALSVQPGKTLVIKNRLVVSPKLQYELEKIEPGLDLTVDYGILTIIAKPLFWLLNFFHTITGNWGWAIILLTISVKLAFYKLSEMSYRSMARMRLVAPRIKQLKERFGDDRQAMSKAMMGMYKKEKINPMGGCLPILVQMPVFLALYWVLLGSVEMRHAPFIFWITNLTGKDPYYILPILMGISMFIQQKLNPAPVDPIQQKIFQVMPFAFSFMFAFFPSGLVLYWVVNNILSISQQYVITRRIENAK